jgi:protease-4
MSNSTKWFLVIAGILLLFGFGMLIIVSLVFVGLSDQEADVTTGTGQKIAVVELKGEITSSEEIVRQFRKYRENRSIKGILFRVDSPGGGVVASQEIYEEVKKTRDGGKPVVVSMGSLAASGGYYVSCGASRIVANPGTLTGSIGVISQFMNFDTLMHKVGVGVNTIKSGKFKDAGNPFRAMSGDDAAYFQRLMDDVHQQFIGVVEEERKLPHDSVVTYADGRVFTGEQAYAMKLVDSLGTYEDAVGITARLAGISDDPAVVKERRRGLTMFERIFGEVVAGNLSGLKEELFHRPILQYRMMQGF